MTDENDLYDADLDRAHGELTHRSSAGTFEVVDDDSLKLHIAAEKLLAERNRINGRSPVDYTESQYIEALEEAQTSPTVLARRGDRHLDKALRDLGLHPEQQSTTVTEAQIKERAEQILLERHGVSPDEDLERKFRRSKMSNDELKEEDRRRRARPERVIPVDIDEAEVDDAYRQAIEELGPPGSERKTQPAATAAGSWAKTQAEGLVRAALAKGTLTADAIEGGKIYAEAAPGSFCEAYRVTLAEGERHIPEEMRGRSIYRDPKVCEVARELSTVVGGRVMRPDDESLMLHMRAEEILRAEGKTEPTHDEYADAVFRAADPGDDPQAEEERREKERARIEQNSAHARSTWGAAAR